MRCLRASEIEEKEAARTAIVTHPVADASLRAPVLTLRDVLVRYGSAPVLSGIDLDVMPESCLAVVGESGSGKTTLARCIVGLHQNWTGDMSFEGTRLAAGARHRPKELLQRMQYIFQNPYTSLNPRKTIGQIVSQPLEHFFDLSLAERSQKVQRVLEDVSLGADFFNRYPDQLSGGERQRVAIARALVVEPDLLVCDEVTSALDVSVQAIIVELLRRLQSEHHLAMIFITHNLALVRSIAQDAVVLCEGRLVESGTVDDVLEHPEKRPTRSASWRTSPSWPVPASPGSRPTAGGSRRLACLRGLTRQRDCRRQRADRPTTRRPGARCRAPPCRSDQGEKRRSAASGSCSSEKALSMTGCHDAASTWASSSRNSPGLPWTCPRSSATPSTPPPRARPPMPRPCPRRTRTCLHAQQRQAREQSAPKLSTTTSSGPTAFASSLGQRSSLSSAAAAAPRSRHRAASRRCRS